MKNSYEKIFPMDEKDLELNSRLINEINNYNRSLIHYSESEVVKILQNYMSIHSILLDDIVKTLKRKGMNAFIEKLDANGLLLDQYNSTVNLKDLSVMIQIDSILEYVFEFEDHYAVTTDSFFDLYKMNESMRVYNMARELINLKESSGISIALNTRLDLSGFYSSAVSALISEFLLNKVANRDLDGQPSVNLTTSKRNRI